MWHSHPTVQGQWKQNKDKHDAATLLTGLANFPHHLAPILTLLLLFFGLLMFIPALIIISSLFFHFSPPLLVLMVILILIALLTLNLPAFLLFTFTIFSTSIISFSLPSLTPSTPTLSVYASPPSLSLCHVNARYLMPLTVGWQWTKEQSKRSTYPACHSMLTTLPRVYCKNPGPPIDPHVIDCTLSSTVYRN